MNQVLLTNGPLRLRFEKQGDRYAQQIEVLEAGNWTTLARSDEGTGDQAWPHSPPWQELTIEQRGPSQQIIFTVGKAGTAHWSGSFTNHSSGGILCEIACRTGRAPLTIGSTYRTLQRDLPAELFIRTTPETKLIRELRQFTLQPTATPRQFPATLVWNYTLFWRGGAER